MEGRSPRRRACRRGWRHVQPPAVYRKAGFYPTPERVIEMILGHLSPTPGCQVIDPCAGEGVALRRTADHLQGAAQAIELSRERALACRQRGLKTYCGDALGYRGRGFGLLYLNPPYDDGMGERLERTFLKHWSEALLPGGVLVYLIPERVIGAVEDYLIGWYRSLRVLRFPEPEYQAFRQVVIFGVRRGGRCCSRGAALPPPGRG
jgi:16S rRNA G966 N2-methylase RsmD